MLSDFFPQSLDNVKVSERSKQGMIYVTFAGCHSCLTNHSKNGSKSHCFSEWKHNALINTNMK